MNKSIEILNDLYSSEINYQINTFWDYGYTVKIGDKLNGVKQEQAWITSFDDAVSELCKLAIIHYPESNFAKKYKNCKN